ncbi:uncharacterized protein LOC111327856 [Stylophora pistillata]|uniref:uncharacterized protein LOC111327856 n=1 Tax=Stylophora pistillata TaxID=50429 RepID=UPI000C0577FD|nr:uncharacterized protein LOC111327856 [Stylophora pistillata]XP_022787888.1 uncharacterized protein LOC111327856 [Stylophora pistillata]XP_022787889.1 uncharacterized protein LOC111327856 [Stylophora pistillata]
MFEDSAFLVASSMSYICLFFVLTFFKYEVIFRTGVILVAATGFFFPILYGLPYIIILWRILVGLNVATDQELYIARCIEQIDLDKADFSSSTTLNHWAVVIQESGGYFYTHAVGNVISGKGKKIPFKEMEEDTLAKYRLDHVGFVTRTQRETKIRELVDAEPMVSGNSCQEYAVDIAFQLSSSRTYTFVKIMALPRMRNTILFIAVALSTAFAVFGHPYARVLNPLFLTNLFAAWELSRIGIHNQAQKVHLQYISSVFRAYIIYPRRGDFFLLLFICGCFAFLYQQLDSRELIVISSLVFVLVLVLLKRTHGRDMARFLGQN